MTDAEGIRLLAEKVMGWKVLTCGRHDKEFAEFMANPTFPYLESSNEAPALLWELPYRQGHYWNPSTSISDAFMLVDKMRERGWDGAIDIMEAGYDCQFHRRPPSGNFDEVCRGDVNPARAIFLACIEALKGTE